MISLVACKPDEYMCDDGECIEASLLCDGTKDCSEGDDETYCTSEYHLVDFMMSNCVP